MKDNFNDFQVKKAFHEKQVAYDEMAKAREKMATTQEAMVDKYSEVEKLQIDYNESCAKQDQAWQKYNEEQLNYKQQIGDVIASVIECNKLNQSLTEVTKNPEENPAVVKVYAEGARFFATMARKKIVERDKLITLKRNAQRPDNSITKHKLAALKIARAEHADLLEEYHNAKNEFSVKKQNFDRLNEKFKNLRSENGNSNNYSNRPERLENHEGLLIEAKVPREFWDDCKVSRRADGRIDIYYGDSDITSHGHIIMSKGKVEYHRPPQSLNS